VTDPSPQRRTEATATLKCKAYPELASLLADRDVELVVIATPSHVHAAQAIEALDAGKHVVVEKPMALSAADADRMIAAAARAERGSGRLLTIFQNRRYWGDFLKVKEVLASGKLGRIVQVKATMSRFTRRWDWQTLREFGGGMFFNAGAHMVDLALQLLPPEVEAKDLDVFVDAQHALSSGDAEDHAKIVLRAPKFKDAPTLEVEVSNACAYPPDTWHVMATAGGLHGSPEKLQWKWLDAATLPDRPVDRNQAAADRRFNREELPWQEESWTKTGDENGDYAAFYDELYPAIRAGKPLAITPASVRRTISVLEKCSEIAGRE
jgi:predicted dehydrogenase